MLIVHFLSQGECSTFNDSFDISWGNDHVKLLNNGQTVELSLDKASGSGFTSKNKYLFGSFNMKIKLIAGNSAGTVTAYYVCKQVSEPERFQ
ncbi:hypothetical protein SUGI_0378580 [Cryptomeria japonica]|nr:hypothetical protein SUGI_0378580 [Cryptomeria japonica]